MKNGGGNTFRTESVSFEWIVWVVKALETRSWVFQLKEQLPENPEAGLIIYGRRSGSGEWYLR